MDKNPSDAGRKHERAEAHYQLASLEYQLDDVTRLVDMKEAMAIK